MWSLCFTLVVWFGFTANYNSSMTDKRPKRQRKVRSSTEFFGAGLLHKEEAELRRALNASLRKVRNDYPKIQEKPRGSVMAVTRSVCNNTNTRVHQKEGKKSDKPVTTCRTICTGTNTRFRIKSDHGKKSENTKKGKGNLFGKKTVECERKGSEASQKRSQVLTKPLKRKGVGEIALGSFKKKKKEREASQTSSKVSAKSRKRKGAEETTKGGKDRSNNSLNEEVGKSLAKKEQKSPTKTHKVCQASRGKILPKSKAAMQKSFSKRKMKGPQKSKVVQSLTEKFSATVRVKKQSAAQRKKDSEDQSAVEVGTMKQNLGHLEDTRNAVKICELKKQVSNALQGKIRRRLKHKLKNRRLVSPLGEIYIPANVAKTEDFLTFLCLRGNSSLPTCFDVFKDPDPFFTQPAHQFPGDVALSCPALIPMQSSVIYSPPSSCAASESSAASPMSSTDGWITVDD